MNILAILFIFVINFACAIVLKYNFKSFIRQNGWLKYALIIPPVSFIICNLIVIHTIISGLIKLVLNYFKF
jgi:hypothetical protein